MKYCRFFKFHVLKMLKQVSFHINHYDEFYQRLCTIKHIFQSKTHKRQFVKMFNKNHFSAFLFNIYKQNKHQIVTVIVKHYF